MLSTGWQEGERENNAQHPHRRGRGLKWNGDTAGAKTNGVTAKRLVGLFDDESRQTRRRAADGLVTLLVGNARPGDRQVVEDALDSSRPALRWGAAFVLTRDGVGGGASSRAARIAEVAVETLGHPDGDLRWAAAAIIRDLFPAQPRLRQLLATTASKDENEQRVKMSLYCLRNIGEKDAGVFAEGLGHKDSGVRLAALSGLAATATTTVAVLAGIEECECNDSEPGVRRAAAAVLARLRGSR